ncbi:MAG: energy-coupling factor transporter ATPase [Lachnospiraceae bacterium]|nr:energy-coupling factor transporter ATPase [Lachnospiraceae bacterium]
MSIKLEHVSLDYEDGGRINHALKDVTLEIPDNQFVGLIGHTGSGKSSLIQHLNGLLHATSGTIYYNGENIYAEGYSMRKLRNKVGLVFQYPEHQLFEVDVFADVCFGPKNQGLSEEEVKERAREALNLVGLDESYYKKSPFELSGGQKRRVAIAGVLAMNPEVLVLDEPTAGLDPRGRDEILGQIKELKEQRNMTIVLVSHSMEDVARYVDRLIVMNHGEAVYDGTPREVFRHYKELEKIGLAAPQVTYLMHQLKERGLDVNTDVITIEEAREELKRVLSKKKNTVSIQADSLLNVTNEVHQGDTASC